MDGFIIKLNASGENDGNIAHLGVAGLNVVLGLTVDPSGNSYAVDGTCSTDFPVSDNVEQSMFSGVMDAFLSKLDLQGKILWATYFGGSGDEENSTLFLDDQGM